jgi:hypothetical protein
MSGYIGSTPVPQATQHRESFTCTEGQTTFNTAGYTAQFVDVYLNGSHLSPADFTATNGSDVVLGVAASADDVCDIISYTPFEVADATFTGTTTLDGAVVINESSADVDFRVESNGNVNMLFVDGGNDTVAIGTSDTDFDPVADNLIVGTGTGSNGITIYTGSSAGNKGSIFFADTAAGNATNSRKGQITYEQNNEIMTFFTADTKAMEIGFIGAVTMPLQPAFLANPNATQNNIAINSEVTIVFGAEVFDQNADFASNVFTAPVTGKYQLNVSLYVNALDTAADYYFLAIKTSNRTYQNVIDPVFASDPVYWTQTLSILADMDASDTAYIFLQQGGGSAQTDISNSTRFSGYLAC